MAAFLEENELFVPEDEDDDDDDDDWKKNPLNFFLNFKKFDHYIITTRTLTRYVISTYTIWCTLLTLWATVSIKKKKVIWIVVEFDF